MSLSACGPKPCSEQVKKAIFEQGILELCKQVQGLDCKEYSAARKTACAASGDLKEECLISKKDTQDMAKAAVQRIAQNNIFNDPMFAPMKKILNLWLIK